MNVFKGYHLVFNNQSMHSSLIDNHCLTQLMSLWSSSSNFYNYFNLPFISIIFLLKNIIFIFVLTHFHVINYSYLNEVILNNYLIYLDISVICIDQWRLLYAGIWVFIIVQTFTYFVGHGVLTHTQNHLIQTRHQSQNYVYTS